MRVLTFSSPTAKPHPAKAVLDKGTHAGVKRLIALAPRLGRNNPGAVPTVESLMRDLIGAPRPNGGLECQTPAVGSKTLRPVRRRDIAAVDSPRAAPQHDRSEDVEAARLRLVFDDYFTANVAVGGESRPPAPTSESRRRLLAESMAEQRRLIAASAARVIDMTRELAVASELRIHNNNRRQRERNDSKQC